MPANPRRLPELRLDDVRRPLEVERRADDRPRGELLARERVLRDLLDELDLDRLAVERREREALDRDRLELDRPDDDFFFPRCALVSPFSRRILFTVRAATSSARPPYRPDFSALFLIFWYWRSRFGLAPAGMGSSLRLSDSSHP